MRIITWNVNGIRAVLKKEDLKKTEKKYNLSDFINEYKPDALCLQETKLQRDMAIEIPDLNDGYEIFYNSAEKKGYSGTLTMSKKKPLSIFYDMSEKAILRKMTNIPPAPSKPNVFCEHHKFAKSRLPAVEIFAPLTQDKNKLNINSSETGTVAEGNFDIHNEGRLITLEYEKFFLINEYTPNYGRELETNTRGNHLPDRVGFRMFWEDKRREYLQSLDKKKPIILCGDLNVAHEEIDLKNPKANRNNAGFTDEEREKMTVLLNSKFTDIFRKKYPDKEDAYTWWSYRFNARKNNSGWRIDYFICSERLYKKVKSVKILNEIYGSDHCPVLLEMG